MKRVLTWLIATACVTGFFVVKDYFPKKQPPAVRAAEQDLARSKRHEAELTARLRTAEQELEHSHRNLVSTDAPLKRDSLAYAFAKTHLDTTDVDSLHAQVKRGDAVIVDQQKKITALEADTAAKAKVIISQRALLVEKDEKSAALDRLNAGIRAQIPTRAQQLKHDAQVVGFTLSAIGVLGAIAAIAQ